MDISRLLITDVNMSGHANLNHFWKESKDRTENRSCRKTPISHGMWLKLGSDDKIPKVDFSSRSLFLKLQRPLFGVPVRYESKMLQPIFESPPTAGGCFGVVSNRPVARRLEVSRTDDTPFLLLVHTRRKTTDKQDVQDLDL